MARPLPFVSPMNRFYWEAGKDGALKIQRCQDCSTWIHPAQPICRNCLSENVAPEAVAGTGKIFSITINHQMWAPGLEVPYAIARVKLDGVGDTVLLTTNIVGEGALEAKIDDPVKVVFEEQDGVWFPLFERTGTGSV